MKVRSRGVETGDGEIGLGHGELDVADHVGEQWKVAEHGFEECVAVWAGLQELLEGVTHAEPGWNGMAALHPAEDPRDGAKVVETATV